MYILCRTPFPLLLDRLFSLLVRTPRILGPVSIPICYDIDPIKSLYGIKVGVVWLCAQYSVVSCVAVVSIRMCLREYGLEYGGHPMNCVSERRTRDDVHCGR